MSLAADRLRWAADRADFLAMLEEWGFTEELVRAQSRDLTDRDVIRPAKLRALGVWVKPSQIEGVGLIARREFSPGETIMTARHNGMRTQGGRYVNHSRDPNARMIMVTEGTIVLGAMRWIVAGAEITTDYRKTLREQGIKPAAERA